MLLLLLSIAWVLLVAGLLGHAIAQYRHYSILRPIPRDGNSPAIRVSVIVPARNEETNIARCLDGLLRQDYPRECLQIVVVDDDSQDGTVRAVTEVAAGDDRVRLVRNASLPAGWLGKPHACWRGVEEAEGEWLCFIDADTVGEPPLIRTALTAALGRRLDMLSLQPFQELGTPWERLLLPTGFFLMAFTQDLQSTNDPASPKASVNGQFLLVRRSAYEAAGGHAAVRDAVAEDSALAVRVKRAGCTLAVLGTEGLLHTRMYTTFRSLWEGAARQTASLLAGLRLPGATAAAFVLAWTPIALPAACAAWVARGGAAPAIIALVLSTLGSLALLGTHVGAARYFRIPFWYGLLFPAGYTLGAGVGVFAWWERSRGQIRWKSRIYQPTSAVPDPVAGETTPT